MALDTTATLAPGELRILSAYPDPPFDLMTNGGAQGFDSDLMRALGARLGLRCSFDRYAEPDFNGIFASLGSTHDVVISGTTITLERQKVALFSDPYAIFDQGVAVNRARTPKPASIADLAGAVVGIQTGNTSDIVAREWLASGKVSRIAYYAYDAIGNALDDLTAGTIDAVVKLSPVLHALAASRSALEVAFEVPTRERIAIAVAPANATLAQQINAGLHALREDRTLPDLLAKWFPPRTRG